jgi:hypothetical protein
MKKPWLRWFDLIRSAIQLEASLYTVFRRLIDLQFFINFLGFSPFGIQIIMPCFCVIDNDQTGFIPGKYIGENTRLIYDVLHFTEEQDIPGILLLIDFEKAFDSIS